MNKYVHLLCNAKGQTILISINCVLQENVPTPNTFSVEALKQNGEVMAYHAAGRIQFLTEEEYAVMQAERAKVKTPEAAIAEDNPLSVQLQNLVSDIQVSLGKLASLVNGMEVKEAPVRVDKSEVSQSSEIIANEEVKDNLELPNDAPPGMTPDSNTTVYLAKSREERSLFIKTCKDLGTLKMVAMFEKDGRIKRSARSRIANLEREMFENAPI